MKTWSVRPLFQDEHYMLADWWQAWGHPVIPWKDLPPLGYIACEGDRPMLCAFLVLTNAKYAFVTTFVADRETSGKQRERAVRELLEHVEVEAKSLGFSKLIIIPEKDRLRDKIVSSGFYENAKLVHLCVKEI